MPDEFQFSSSIFCNSLLQFYDSKLTDWGILMETQKGSKRRESREKTLLALFQYYLGKNDVETTYRYMDETDGSDAFFHQLFEGIIAHQAEIDKVIKENAEKWSPERFGNVEIHVIRIAVYEMRYQKETPAKVVLNEAIEIVKKYSDEKSAKFVNSILQKIVNSISGVVE